MIVSNSGHLIQLAIIDRLDLLETFFGGVFNIQERGAGCIGETGAYYVAQCGGV